MTADELLCGRYALRGVLGQGGMAVVRDAWDTRLGRAVAVKLLHPGHAADADNRRRFEHEAHSAAALSHPNVVAVYDSGEHLGAPFIVMERLPGNTLADLIARGPLPQQQVHTMLTEVLSALATAHRAGILHRDIKPGNILFTAGGRAKVADFGIAKTGGVDQTTAGEVLGTVAYLSPERLVGTPASPSDDLYAVGVVGYEALTGRRAFPQDTLGSLTQAIMTERPPAVGAVRGDVDPRLAALVERAMAPRAQWRFGSAVEMQAALSGEPAVVGPARPPTMVMTSPVPPLGPPPVQAWWAASRKPPMSKARKIALAVVGLVALVITVAAVVADSFGHPTPAPTSTPSETSATSVPTTTTTEPTTEPATVPTTEPPAADAPKKHGRGHRHDEGG